ncbi:ribonuclease P protein component [Rothia nasimurium]|uniref:ribonuclease P protein component n=1 Tax=Rothia nasimurium TaxID=85336 RepID=UPI001F019BE6|nr:ribonuclease P protein component [Rothia nasimurium]
MLAQQHRMRASAQFSATTRSGARSGRRNLVLYTAKTGEEPTLIGFIVSKAVGNAVTRNKTKRRLREAIAPFVAENPTGYSVVIRALPPAATASYRDLNADLTGALTTALKKLSTPQTAPPTTTREEL